MYLVNLLTWQPGNEFGVCKYPLLLGEAGLLHLSLPQRTHREAKKKSQKDFLAFVPSLNYYAINTVLLRLRSSKCLHF